MIEFLDPVIIIPDDDCMMTGLYKVFTADHHHVYLPLTTSSGYSVAVTQMKAHRRELGDNRFYIWCPQCHYATPVRPAKVAKGEWLVFNHDTPQGSCPQGGGFLNER